MSFPHVPAPAPAPVRRTGPTGYNDRVSPSDQNMNSEASEDSSHNCHTVDLFDLDSDGDIVDSDRMIGQEYEVEVRQRTVDCSYIVDLVFHEAEVGNIAGPGHSVVYHHSVHDKAAPVQDIQSERFADSRADCTGSDQGEVSVHIVMGR